MSHVFHAHHDATQFESFEAGEVQWLRRNGDNDNERLAAGLWQVEPTDPPTPVDLDMHQDETIYIVSGHIRIEVQDGPTLDLTAGSMASLSKGAVTRWTVLEPTVEFFVYS